MYVCIYLCMYVLYVYIYIHAYIYMCVCVHIYIYVCVCVCVYICVCVCVLCVCVYVCAHACMHFLRSTLITIMPSHSLIAACTPHQMATCKINENLFVTVFNGFLYQITTETPSERFPLILQVAVPVSVHAQYSVYSSLVVWVQNKKPRRYCEENTHAYMQERVRRYVYLRILRGPCRTCSGWKSPETWGSCFRRCCSPQWTCQTSMYVCVYVCMWCSIQWECNV